jgi:hypothetical protein
MLVMRLPLTRLAQVALCAAVAAIPSGAQASDHADGLKTALDKAADITDLFVFTSPTDAGKLVLIMNVHPVAFSAAQFSDAVDYKFRIRPIENSKTLAPSSDASKEQSIVCSFGGGLPLVEPKQKATCAFNLLGGTETISFDTRGPDHKAGGAGQSSTTRVFAGVRSDPWFADIVKVVKYEKGTLPPNGPGLNGLYGWNVLSIVVEVDKSRLPGPLLAVTAQTVRK